MAQIKSRTGRTARSVILEAALAAFGESGLNGVSLADVAQRVGVTKAALYHHFATKDELILSAFAPVIEELDRFLADPRPATGRIDELVRLALRHREMVALGDPRAVDGLGQEARAVLEARSARLIEALAGEDSERARVRAVMAIGALCAVLGGDVSGPAVGSEVERVLRAVLVGAGGGSAG